jgi:ketosteroid isomerase-like protein
MDVIARLTEALNAHDAQAMADCFADDYRSEQPAHPARGFGGRDQVAENWSLYFEEIPDVRIDVASEARSGETVWIEVRIHGTRRDRTTFDLRGVIINEVIDDRIASARFYVEPVEEDGAGIQETVKRWAEGSSG